MKLYKLLIISFLLTAFLPYSVQAQSWYNASWTSRKAITIDYTKVGTGPHTNFPVLISRADADLQTGAQADGDDILFTSSDGTTKLSHEIESYTSASGTIVAWVEIPSLSSSANTVIYMYYGNVAATAQQNITGTWDANFKAVHHLNNAFADATSNANNGTNTGTYDMPGKISRGRGFNPNDGGADYINIPGLMGSPANVTLSAWANLTSRDVTGAQVVSIGDHIAIDVDNVTYKTDGLSYITGSWNHTSTAINYAGTGWHYLSYTFNDAGNVQVFYVDGVQKVSTALTGSISYAGLGTNTYIGSHANGNTNFDFNGDIDEVRVSNVARSVGWILTEYNNQNSPATFYSVGSEATNVANYRASASAGATTGVLSLVITKPTGTVSGDVMIAAISVRPNTATITPPSGWTLIRRTNNAASTAHSHATYWKAAGGSEPANYTWSFSASTGSAGGISTFYNVNTTSPINVENGQTTASALTHASPSVTTTLANTIIVTTHSFASCATWTPPTGMTETVDESSDAVPNGAGIAIEMNVIGQAAAGATGAKTATASGDADVGVTQILALAICVSPTTSDAGTDQTGAATCGLTLVTLAANVPSVGTGAWSIVSGSGGTVTTPTSATSTFSGTAGTSYTLRWTISNNPCGVSTDDVVITFNQAPTTSAAGADQTGAATCGLTTVTLAANAPSIGTGAWSIVSGAGGTVTTPTSATSTFSGTAGTAYVLRWTTSNSPCTASTDDVNITFNRNPTTSAAGADQTSSATCGLTIVTLAANAPSIGTGAWSIVSGSGGTVTTPTSATSTFTGTAGTAYVLRWTTSNSPCTASTDDVNITFNRNPTTSAAGADQTGATSCGVTLAANAPSVGTGAWSIISGTGGTVTTPSSATSTFNGTAGTAYTLRWTISNSPCTASADDVIITIISPNTWTGAISTTWGTSGNWVCGVIPTTATNITIPASLSNYPVLNSGTGSVQNITIQNGASLTVTGATLQIAGSISNSGTFTASSGTIEMNGSSAQTIPSGTFSGNKISNLIISNDVTLSGQDSLTGTFSFGNVNSKTFTTGGYLTLKSTATGTARVADLTNGGVNTGNNISGTVKIERFIPAHRAWRLLAAPVNFSGAQTINQVWQEGQTSGNSIPGYGTQITGGTIANGFDQSATNSSSLKRYDNAASGWVPVTNTNNPISDYNGYMLFIRGDRSINLANGPYASATNTVLRAVGQLKAGNQSFAIAATGFTVIGNPFASPVNLNQIGKLNSTNVQDNFYVWDPKITGTSGVGGSVNISWNGSSYDITPSGGSSISQYIQSGSAFFARSANGTTSGTLVIKEADKSSGGSDNVYRGVNVGGVEKLITNLYSINTDGTTSIVDGILNSFDAMYLNAVDNMDAIKLDNFEENLSMQRSGQQLTVERRQPASSSDTIFFNMLQMKVKSYRFVFIAANFSYSGLSAFLEDSYLNTSTSIDLQGTSTFNFDVINAPGSWNPNRFRIVFRQLNVLPVTFNNIKAFKQNENIKVEWNVENEMNIEQYEVERSADGIYFVKQALVNAANNNTNASYNWVDNFPLSNNSYYRIKSVEINGAVKYSSIVQVNMSAKNSGISIYPNPVINVIWLQFNNQPAGMYSLKLINSAGVSVLVRHILHSEGNAAEQIDIPKNLAKGIYQLEIIKPGKESMTFKLIRQ
ncbi:MAG: DUF2341 domain-containing protein [Ginsengibacter sp.]